VSAFADALLVTEENGKVKRWQAMPWYQAGSDIIVLAHSRISSEGQDRSPVGQTGRRSKNGHCRVIDRAEIALNAAAAIGSRFLGQLCARL